MTGKNQVTVPAGIARQMELEPGARFDWTVGEIPGTIVIRVLPGKRARLARAQEIGKTFKDRDLIQELIDERSGEE